MSEGFYERLYLAAMKRRHLVNCGLIVNVLWTLALAWYVRGGEAGNELPFLLVCMAAINGALLWHLNRSAP